MRIIRFFLGYVLVNIFVLLVATFLAQNVHVEHVAFFGLSIQTNFVWLMLGAASFGFLAALVVVVPGRVIVSLRVWELDREAAQLERQVALLEEQREDLVSRHEVLIQAREHVLDRYHRLMAEYNELLVRRDEPRVRVAAATAPAAKPKTRAVEVKAPISRPEASTATRASVSVESASSGGEPEELSVEVEEPTRLTGVLSGPVRLVEQLALPRRLQRLQRLLPTLPGSSVID